MNLHITISTDLISTNLPQSILGKRGFKFVQMEGVKSGYKGDKVFYEIDKLTNFKNPLQYQDPFISNKTQSSLG